MEKKDMTFAEIKTNKELFLQQYNLQGLLPKCGISWETLIAIGDDYETKCYGNGQTEQEYKGIYFDIIKDHITKIASFENVHSYRFRIKKTSSLLAKIIKKAAERQTMFTPTNYFQKITDLLGIRILYVFKEDYWPIHQQIMTEYENQLAEDINIKLKKGDDREMYRSLLQKYSNVRVEENLTYRSIHYTIYARKNDIDTYPRVEIQTRTIFEEGWSEISHKLVYKEGAGNQGLKSTSDVLSSMVGACDNIGMLMKTLYDAGIQSDTSSSKDSKVSSQESDVVQVIKNFLLQ